VTQELLLRHRAKRVMIVCPAGLTVKWRDEMAEKFGPSFLIVNSEQCATLRRTHGSAANPFRTAAPPASRPTERWCCCTSKPLAMGSGPGRGRTGLGAGMPAPRNAGPLPDPGRDQRRAKRRRHGYGHRMGSDPAAVRPADQPVTDTGNRAQPSGRARRSPRPGRRTGGRRPAQPGHLPPVPRHPGRPAAPPGPHPDAAEAYDAALALTTNAAERAFLQELRRILR
jgi:hypothetical protein